jgi:hypothetical protein
MALSTPVVWTDSRRLHDPGVGIWSGVPTVLVQEGGYELETTGPLVRALLEGIECPLDG